MSGRILIVDDHEVIRKALRSLLSTRAGWTICAEAADGIEAVEKARSARPDLILMDISMPRMNGLEATRIIRRERPESQIVIISQNDPEIVSRQAQEAGASSYLAKKDLSRSLLSTVSKFLADGAPEPVTPAKLTTPTADWLSGGGDVGRLIREYNWSQTSLGPIDSWAQSLKTSVSICLASRFPIVLFWGPEFVLLYNDAYTTILGDKHPRALGQSCRECWSEIWDTIGPMLESVVRTGEATWSNDLFLPLHRYGYAEECYFSFSYSVVQAEAGTVGGIFTAVIETTESVVGERRLRTLRDLAAKTVDAKSKEDAHRIAAETLSENLYEIPFSALCAGANGQLQILSSTGIPADHHLRSVLADPGSSLAQKLQQVVRGDRPMEVDLQTVGCEFPTGGWDVPALSALLMPIAAAAPDGSPGVLVCGINPKKKLDESYRTFFSLVSRQIVTSIAEACAREQERKRAEALAELDRAKTAFFSNISHEFRTPLTLMLGPIEDLLTKSSADLPSAAKTQLELVSRNGTRLLRLVNTLLDFSRIEAGRAQARYQPTDVASFTLELASVFRSATEKAGLRLELDCPPLPEPVYVDRGMWEKIVLNLISNAFKFTFEGEIAITLSSTGNEAELRVRDTGVGIPAHELPHLFDRFHRIENNHSRTHEGSGIGLALVQELVNLHGGTVRVESTPGEGTTFTLRVPFGKDHLPVDRVSEAQKSPSPSPNSVTSVTEALWWLSDEEARQAADAVLTDSEPMGALGLTSVPGAAESAKRTRILVADDNADMRQYLVRLLAERYDVVAVPDGQAALAAVWKHSPELVLADVMMPNLDGFGLLHALRADPQTRTIPVIFLSARAGEESRVEGMGHGADDYLIKPFSARELLARVQTHLEMARVRQRAEVALRRRTEQFETLVNEAPLGVFQVDEAFRIRAANPRAMRFFGNPGDLIGRDFVQLIHLLWPEAYANETVERFRHTLKTGEPYLIPEHIEERVDTGVREIYEWQISRIPLPEGGYGVVCYFREISRQVQARETIAESEKRLRLACQAAELGIWHWYPEDDRVTWESDLPHAVFGRTRGEGVISGAAFRKDICHPDDLPEFERALAHTLKTGARFFFQGRILRKGGACIWVEFTAQVELGPDGKPWRVLGTVRDITERKQAEEAVRQSEERLRLAQKAGRAGTWEWNFASRELITSPELQEVYGLSSFPSRLDTEHLRAMIYPGDLATLDKLLAHAVQTHGDFHGEFRIARTDGAERWLETTARIFYDESGKPLRVVGISTDITERKKTQDALADHKERLRLALMAAGMSTWDTDVVADKVVWSDNIAPQSGMTPGSFSGSFAEFLALVHPEDRERVAQAVQSALYQGTDYHLEFRKLCAGDGVRWTESRGSVFRDENARPKRMMGIDLDITARKQMEERERQITAEAVAATAKFRAVFEQTPVFAGIVALDGIIVDANRLSLDACGYYEEDVLGRPFWKAGWWRHSQETQAKIRDAIRQAAQGTPYRETLTYHWADDTERLVDLAVHPIRDQQGRILFLHPTGVDITDLKRTEEKYRTLAESLDAEVRARTSEVVQQAEQLRDLSSRLLQAQDEERRHIARELHDSAGQLLTVLGLNLAQAAQNAPVEASEIVKWIRDSENLVQQLSQEIRTMSYLLHPPLLEDRGLLESIRWYIEGLAERSGLEIALEVPQDFSRLPAEMELVMFRLVQECLTNIHRHSGSATAAIHIARKSKTVTLEIRDQGKGLSAAKLAEIQSLGSGVGIRGMRERVRHFGGRMHIASSAAGTTISFDFPIAEAAAPKRATTNRKPRTTKKAPVAG